MHRGGVMRFGGDSNKDTLTSHGSVCDSAWKDRLGVDLRLRAVLAGSSGAHFLRTLCDHMIAMEKALFLVIGLGRAKAKNQNHRIKWSAVVHGLNDVLD